MKLVIGLGNPGRRYQETRHNVGFDVIERLISRWHFSEEGRNQFGSVVCDGQIKGLKTLLVRPQQYMNRSGQPVASIMGYYKLTNADTVVVHDDIGLPFGTVRCREGGGHGGHNGLRDMFRCVGKEFLRVRVGVGRPPKGWDTADFVLGRWNDVEMSQLDELIGHGSDAVESIVESGIVAEMNRFNIRDMRTSKSKEEPEVQEA